MKPTKRIPKCPICKKETRKADNKSFPFCSSRCQMVDLGRWLDEDYSMPAQLTERDMGQLEAIISREQDD